MGDAERSAVSELWFPSAFTMLFRPQRVTDQPQAPRTAHMSTILVIVAVVFVVIVILKAVRVTEVTPGDSVQVTASVSAREKVVGTKRLERRAELDASQRPRAARLWKRVSGKLDSLAKGARERAGWK